MIYYYVNDIVDLQGSVEIDYGCDLLNVPTIWNAKIYIKYQY